MYITRRCGLFAAVSLVMAACTPNPDNSPKTPAQIIAEASNMVQGLDTMLKQLNAQYPTLIPPDVFASIESNVQLALAIASQLADNLPVQEGATKVREIVGYVNAVLNTLAAPPTNGLIPAPYNQVLAAVAFVAPLLEAFVTQYVPATAAVAPRTSVARQKFSIRAVDSREKADGILMSWAHK